MCPLRLILIFLSATLAGFFVVRNLKSRPFSSSTDGGDDDSSTTITDSKNSPQPSDSSSSSSSSRFSKVRSGIELGFWTVVDMASGKYLWRHLGSSSKRES